MNKTINKEIKKIVENFVNTVLRATEEEKKEERLLQEIPQKLNELQKITFSPKDVPDRFRDFFNDFFQKIAEFNNKQKIEIENRLKILNELLFTRCRNRTIVVVCGIVKAGKSALGNFIVGKPFYGLGGSPYESLNYKIETWDEKGGHFHVDSLEELEEDVTEATKNIHIIEMGGMVWVDTPGLGSLSINYGEKARNFMNNADVIIFLTPSDIPLSNSELEEIKKCTFRQKRLVVLISRSDDSKDDINEAGDVIQEIIPKSSREKQEEYVMEELSKREDISRFLEIKDVFSISTKLALEGIRKGDVEKFKDSNLEKFYDLLKKLVIERREKLKRENIKSQLTGLVGEILSDVRSLQRIIDDKISVVERSKEKLMREKQELHNRLDLKLDSIFHRASLCERQRLESIKNDKKVKPYPIQEELNKIVKSLLEEAINSILHNTLKTIVQIQDINSDIQIEGKEKVESREYKIIKKEYYKVEKSLDGFWEWVRKIFTLGFAKFYKIKEDIKEEVVRDTISYFDSDGFKDEFDKKIKTGVANFVDEEFERIQKEIIDVIARELSVQKGLLENFRQKIEALII